MDRRPRPSDRLPLGCGRRRLDTICSRRIVDRGTGRDSGQWRRGGTGSATVDPRGSSRFHRRGRSNGGRFGASLARPGGNLTGFTTLETSVGAKLLELLKDIAPRLTRIAVLINPDNPGSPRLSESAASAARKFAVDVVALPVRNSAEIEAAMARWGREPGAGLIVPPDPSTNSYRQLIVELASRYRIPAIHTLRAAAVDGALMSYGVDIPSLHREAASYVDRILKGEKPADLPVQQPTKFEFVINLKTAKTLGLTFPITLLGRADEVIE